ncbi:MAG: S1C family serine protease [Solirubrobacteraceae bacterium]
MRLPRFTVALVSIPLVLSAVGGCGGSTKTVNAPRPVAGPMSLEQSFVAVIDRVAPEVVQISSPNGLGSGIAFDNNGDVVTNDHVVAGGGPLKVTDARGSTYSASLVGTFAPDDVAVVRARGASLPRASFADSSTLKVGDIVLALGNPLGLRSSVTNGIISALGRTVGEPTGAVLPNVIQTSAPINPGNSGGALVDLQGKVVGIPTLAASDPQLGGGAAPGIGFAIPSSLVTDIAGQIVKYGHVVTSHRAYLGIELATGLSSRAVVTAVRSSSPAAHAGIVVGDVIAAINGKQISGPPDVAAVLAGLTPGQAVAVKITKPDGSPSTVNVTLGQYPGR